METFTIYTARKEVLLCKGTGRHIDEEYELVEDVTAGDERTIRLKRKDRTEELNDKKKLVALLAGKLGEPSTGLFAKLLADTMLDYRSSDVSKMIKAVESGKPVSKAPTHCFRLHIGDGRKKNSFTLALRD